MHVCSNSLFFPHPGESERRSVQTFSCRKIQKEICYFSTKEAAKFNCDDYLGDGHTLHARCVVEWENGVCASRLGRAHTFLGRTPDGPVNTYW